MSVGLLALLDDVAALAKVAATSLDDIAGILNERRNVLGMMPHPERLAEDALGGTDGRPMFEGLLAALG